MSSNVKKCLLTAESVLNCESHKKPRRKRHRNKSRNSNLKKKRFKRFHYKNKPYMVTSSASEFDLVPDNSKVMSSWYWSNYKKALEWQEKHRSAHWKACALALLEENRYLLQMINHLDPGMHPEVPITNDYLNMWFPSVQKHMNFSQSNANIFSTVRDEDKNENDDNDDGNDDDNDDDDNDLENEENEMNDVEFEMSEEMIEFFKESYKHKMELKKLKEKESLSNTENEIKQLQNNKVKRSAEMKLLYGDGASMITGMETAVQLSFEKYCDSKSPKYWPNIPFRL